MTTVSPVGVAARDDVNVAREVSTELRLLVVAGIPFGVVVAGVGGRLAMLLLRLTSPDLVSGVDSGLQSDDGFRIGESTLAGTYNLLLLGATVGVLGTAAYRAVSPRLIGPMWFRRVTVASACAAVVGSMLVHDEGVDFHFLTPTWLAIGLFVALPGLFGLLIGPWVDHVARHESWPTARWARWALPIVLVACFPLTLFVVVPAAAVLFVWVTVRSFPPVRSVRRSGPFTVAVQGLWLGIAAWGLVSLVGDITAISG